MLPCWVNHDYEKGRHKLIRQILLKQGVHILDGESIVINNVGFAGVKGFGGGFDRHMLSFFGEGAMKAFVQEAVDEALHLDRALSRLDQINEISKKSRYYIMLQLKKLSLVSLKLFFLFLVAQDWRSHLTDIKYCSLSRSCTHRIIGRTN